MNPRNTVTLIGRLGKDPEKKTTASGKTVTSFSVATNETYRDANGERQKNTEWHDCVAWGKQADNLARLLTKGQEIVVNGKLRSREWEDSKGSRHRRTEIFVDRVELLGSKVREGAKEE